MVSGKLLEDESVDSGLGQSREHAQSGNGSLDTGEKESRVRNGELALKSLLRDCRSTSALHLRWVFSSALFRIYFLFLLKHQFSPNSKLKIVFFYHRDELLRLRSENAELRGLLKEQKSTECKEKESTDASGNSSEGLAESRRSDKALHARVKGDSKSYSKLLKERGEKKSDEVSEDENSVTTVSAADKKENLPTKGQAHNRSAKQHFTRQRVNFASQRQAIMFPICQWFQYAFVLITG